MVPILVALYLVGMIIHILLCGYFDEQELVIAFVFWPVLLVILPLVLAVRRIYDCGESLRRSR